MDEENFDPDRFLEEAYAAGLNVEAEGNDLVLEAASEPSANLLATFERHGSAILARLKDSGPKSTVFIVAPEDDFPDLPEFLDRVKHPKPGDIVPTWPRHYPSGGLIKKGGGVEPKINRPHHMIPDNHEASSPFVTRGKQTCSVAEQRRRRRSARRHQYTRLDSWELPAARHWSSGCDWAFMGMCGAKRTAGPSYTNVLELGRSRYRLYGGAFGSGAPPGNNNGRYIIVVTPRKRSQGRPSPEPRIRAPAKSCQTRKPPQPTNQVGTDHVRLRRSARWLEAAPKNRSIDDNHGSIETQ